MPVTLEQFTKQVAQSGLMSEGDITALLASLPDGRQPKDAEGLARELVKQKKLTTYQAQEIYAGRGKQLVLGNYVVLDKLGQGGMGLVLKAEHRRMKRLVALKVLSPSVTKTPEAQRRFQREVEAAAKLRHMNIVAADDADEAAGIHFLVMEYVEGSDLSALVKKSGPLPLDRALNCIIQAARGLEYAHARGVVHRDIKPSNLLLDQSGTVKILDMGLARLQSATPEQDELTGSGQIMGTVDYMAPEQAMSTRNVDARVDIYSLGITFWYLLSAYPMYEGETAIAKLMAHQTSPIPSLAEHCPVVTPQLQAAFAKMVAKRPADRYQSMTEVIAALEPYRGLSAAAATISSHSNEDPQLAALLRGSHQPGSSGAALAAKGAAAKSAAVDATIDSGLRKADTDPQTQSALPIPLHRAVQPVAKRVAPVAAAPPKQQPVKFIVASVAAIIVLCVAIVCAIVFRGQDELTAEKQEPAARIDVPPSSTVTVEPARPKPPTFKPEPLPAQPKPVPTRPQPGPSTAPIAASAPELSGSSGWKVVDAQRIALAALGVESAVHPHASGDGLALIFADGTNNDAELMLSTRTSTASGWNKAVLLKELNSGVQDAYGAIDQEQLSAVFFSKREGDHLWVTGRLATGVPFRTPISVGLTVNKANVRSWYPGLSANGRWLTFVQEIFFRANKAFIGERTGPNKSVPVVRELGPEIDDLGYCRGAAVTDDGLTIVVDVGQHEADTPTSLWMASRSITTAPFTNPVLIGKFDPSRDGNILNPTLSGDGSVLWFIHQGALVRCERPVPRAAQQAPGPQVIDLIAALDLQRDRISVRNYTSENNWTIADGQLTYHADGKSGKVIAPVDLTDARDYEILMHAKRLSGNGEFTIDFPTSASLGSGLDLFMGGRISLKLVGGQRSQIGAWPPGMPEGTVAVHVRQSQGDELGSVTVNIDGVEVGRWDGDISAIGKAAEWHPAFLNRMTTGLFCYKDSFQFTSWQLRVYDGRATELK